jgi:hypothetical protein
MSTGPDSWVGIPKVDLSNVKEIKLMVASDNPASTIEIRKDSPTGERLAKLKFKETGESTYTVPSNDGSGATLHEMAYVEVTKPLKTSKGTSNLYLVFDNKDIRVDTIQLIEKKSK